MKVGIMQPYFFPYLGYWQLINAVDKFVILDDVNYIMRGYINRNSILLSNSSVYKFSISMDNPSQNKKINESRILFPQKEREDFLKTIEMAYHKAPFFKSSFPLIKESVLFPNNDLVAFLTNSILLTIDYLGVDTDIIISSKVEKNSNLTGQDRIIEINKKLDSNIYINPIGGQMIYDKECFIKNGIELLFLKMNSIEYKQFDDSFVPNLSLIDTLMFNSKDELKILLNKYELI